MRSAFVSAFREGAESLVDKQAMASRVIVLAELPNVGVSAIAGSRLVRSGKLRLFIQ